MVKKNLIGAIILLVLGVGAIVGGLIFKNNTDKKLETWVQVQARIVTYDWRYDDDDIMYTAIVEYEVDGRTYQKKDNSSSNIQPTIGSYTKIAYNPDNPGECIFVTSGKTFVMILFIIGGVFAALGVILILYTVYRKLR